MVKKERVIIKRLKKMSRSRSGFSLIEMITVLAILGTTVGVFYTTWMTNWKSVEEHQARANLWYDSSQIIDSLTRDGRVASQIVVQDVGKTVVLQDKDGVTLVIYAITGAGEMRLISPVAGLSILSTSVDPVLSNFEKIGFSLKLNLFLEETVLSGLVQIQTSAEVYPRN